MLVGFLIKTFLVINAPSYSKNVYTKISIENSVPDISSMRKPKKSIEKSIVFSAWGFAKPKDTKDTSDVKMDNDTEDKNKFMTFYLKTGKTRERLILEGNENYYWEPYAFGYDTLGRFVIMENPAIGKDNKMLFYENEFLDKNLEIKTIGDFNVEIKNTAHDKTWNLHIFNSSIGGDNVSEKK